METGGTGFQPVKEFRIYRRNLPHWERPESVYFITFRTFKQVILTEDSKNITFNSILFHNNKKYKLYAFVIMPDHVHLLLQPLEKINNSFYSLAEILHSIKSYSANQINKMHKNTGKMPVPPRVWLDENYDRIIRDSKEFQEKMNYINVQEFQTLVPPPLMGEVRWGWREKDVHPPLTLPIKGGEKSRQRPNLLKQ